MEAWLARLGSEMAVLFPFGPGAAAYTYDARESGHRRYAHVVLGRVARALESPAFRMDGDAAPAETVERWHRHRVARASANGGADAAGDAWRGHVEHLRRHGVKDLHSVNGVVARGRGVNLVVALDRDVRFAPATLAAANRIAGLLSHAYARRLDPGHTPTIAGLREIDGACGAVPEGRASAALATILVADLRAGHLAVEDVEDDGDARRLLLRRADASLEVLTEVQRRVAARVLMGLRPKEIGLELELAPSSVAAAVKEVLANGWGWCWQVTRPVLRSASPTAWEVRWRQRSLWILRVALRELDMSSLSPAEADAVRLARSGCSNEAIAAARATSVRTVANQLAAAYRKLGVGGRHELG